MNPMLIEKTIIDLLSDMQSVADEELVQITRTTIPLEELAFFDSLLGPEVTLALEAQFGIIIDEQPLFLDKQTHDARSIAAVADRLAQQMVGAAV